MSMPVIRQGSALSSVLWAAIRAITPVPVPMSRDVRQGVGMVIMEPRSTASVPTLRAESELRTVKRLNLNKASIFHHKAAVAQRGEMFVVSDYDYGLAQGVAQREEDFVDFFFGAGVQVAGRFVGK